MVVFSTGTACTLTVGSLSPLSLEQAAEINRRLIARRLIAAARMNDPPHAYELRGSCGSLKRSMCGLWLICLEAPRQSLQSGDCPPGPDLSVVIGVARLRQRILRVHNFQHRRFACLIAQVGQAETLCRHFGGAGE